MTYLLVSFFLSTGDIYVERRGLTLMQCAGHAATIRQQTLALEPFVGEVRYLCIAESAA